MFGKFGGIVIIALAGAIIAGLILRPTPDLPPAMNLGVPDSSAIPANTLEPTVDNQDKKPAEIKPVTESVDSAETEPEATDEADETKATEADSKDPVEMTADKAKAAAEKAVTEVSEAVENATSEETTTEGTEKSE